MIFEALPPSLAPLCHRLFPVSFPAVSILPLAGLNEGTATHQQWLHEKELKQLQGYAYPKRRREWLAGRLCAKEALHSFLHHSATAPVAPDYRQWRVASEKSGRPYFKQVPGIPSPFPHLSITHSRSFAAALVSASHCGIDIQYANESLQRVKERFCTGREEEQLQHFLPYLPHLSRLALLWTAKEAVKKMLSPTGIPGFHEIELCSITEPTSSTALLHVTTPTGERSPLPVLAGLLNSDYGIALCCQEGIRPVNSSPFPSDA